MMIEFTLLLQATLLQPFRIDKSRIFESRIDCVIRDVKMVSAWSGQRGSFEVSDKPVKISFLFAEPSKKEKVSHPLIIITTTVGEGDGVVWSSSSDAPVVEGPSDDQPPAPPQLIFIGGDRRAYLEFATFGHFTYHETVQVLDGPWYDIDGDCVLNVRGRIQ